MTLLILLSAFCLLSTILYLTSRKRKQLAFPGPKGLPFVGSFLDLTGRNIRDLFLEWSVKFGGVFRFSIFGKQYLVVSSPEAVHEVLVTRGKDWRLQRLCQNRQESKHSINKQSGSTQGTSSDFPDYRERLWQGTRQNRSHT